MFKKILIITLSLLQTIPFLLSQNLGVNEDGSAAHPAAILDVKSENKGILIPRIGLVNVTSSAPIISPANGLLVYNTNPSVIGGFGEGYYSWNGTEWLKITTGQSLSDLNFINGTIRDVNDIKLGGTLSENTTINKNGNNLNFTGTGNMGIGTTSPTSLLHIVETGNVGGISGLLIQESNAGQALTIEESGNGSALLITANDNGSGIISTTQGTANGNTVGTILNEIRTSSTGNITKVGLDISSTGTWNGANAQNIGLRVNATGGTTNYAAILNGGNVGVNVPTPIARIQSEATIGQDAIAGLSVGNIGVVGIDFATTGASRGVLGQSTSTDGIGVLGNATATTGATRGIFGLTSSNSLNSHGVYGFKLGVANGTGYLFSSTQVGVLGVSDWGQNFRAGVQGVTWSNDPGNRTSGVIGIFQNATTTWGALAYKTSGNAGTAVYGTAAYSSGAGYMNNNHISGVGIGGYGGVIGSWTRGEVMGHIAAGELFASYSLGNAYTSGYNAEIVELENERVAVYSMTGKDVKVYHDGTDQLENGRKVIYFDDEFQQIIGDNIPVITVSPMGMCNGLYISNVTNKSFEVLELANGQSDVAFSFILIAKRKDNASKPNLPVDLAKKDFDNNLKDVMFNENYLEQTAKPIWWDGKNVRFDELPENQSDRSKEEIKNELGIKPSIEIYERYQQRID
ncbi:MAG: hypothetical protein JJT77_07030 [Crocinitomicaceae bacterium]|nr:hypothetical protein [Crocinitomicaceae bacterium]